MKRISWLAVGYMAGLSTAAWLRARIRRTVVRYSPDHLRTAAVGRARDLTDRARQSAVSRVRDAGREARRVAGDFKAATAYGHQAMRRTETELQTEAELQTEPQGEARL